jgi:SSS family solute:Na+ symporter
MSFAALDYIILAAYFALILGVGLWVSRKKPGAEQNAADYFLAGKGLSWWVIGASLIASNISAEQFIGMSGSGFAIGMGIASYEFMAAITLIIVAVFFMPIFLKMGIYTMPEYLARRYDGRVKTTMAVFWLLVFVFVNLSSILYLGALTIKNVMFDGADIVLFGRAVDPLFIGIVLLGAFSAAYSVYGGLKSVAVTDVIQVVFLIGGGLITTYIALQYASVEATAAPHRRDTGNRRFCHHDRPAKQTLRRNRETRRGLPVAVAQLSAERHQGSRVRGADRRDCELACFDDEQHLDHLHDGYLPRAF